MPEIGWFSSTREEDAGIGVLRPKAAVPLTWPYACGRSRRPSASGGKRPARALQGPRVDENLSISGRCPPVFLPRKLAEKPGRAGAPERAAPRARKRTVDRAIESSRQECFSTKYRPSQSTFETETSRLCATISNQGWRRRKSAQNYCCDNRPYAVLADAAWSLFPKPTLYPLPHWT